MSDLFTLSTINIVTATTSVILALFLTEGPLQQSSSQRNTSIDQHQNDFEFPSFHLIDYEYQNGTFMQSAQLEKETQPVIDVIVQKLHKNQVKDALLIWQSLETAVKMDKVGSPGKKLLTSQLSKILFRNEIELTSLLQFIKGVNFHLRVAKYEQLVDTLIQQTCEAKKDKPGGKHEENLLLIISILIKQDWLAPRRNLKQSEIYLLASVMRKFPPSIKTIIFTSSVSIQKVTSEGKSSGYLYATGNKALYDEKNPKERPVFLWAKKPGQQPVAREGYWSFEYDEDSKSFTILNSFWKETLCCRHHHHPLRKVTHDEPFISNEHEQINQEYQEYAYDDEHDSNVFTKKVDTSTSAHCANTTKKIFTSNPNICANYNSISSQWLISFENSCDGDNVQIFIKSSKEPEHILSLTPAYVDADDENNNMGTKSQPNYRQRIEAKEIQQFLNGTKNNEFPKWKLSPIKYIF